VFRRKGQIFVGGEGAGLIISIIVRKGVSYEDSLLLILKLYTKIIFFIAGMSRYLKCHKSQKLNSGIPSQKQARQKENSLFFTSANWTYIYGGGKL